MHCSCLVAHKTCFGAETLLIPAAEYVRFYTPHASCAFQEIKAEAQEGIGAGVTQWRF